jgi:tetratricopeptide (TPR) repeat protein
MASIVCQVFNRDDLIQFTWSLHGGFFPTYTITEERGRLAELRNQARETREALGEVVTALNLGVEATVRDRSAELARAGYRLYECILPRSKVIVGEELLAPARTVREWLETKTMRGRGPIGLEIVVDDSAQTARTACAIPWNLVYDKRFGQHDQDFQNGQNQERWRPFWGMRYVLTSGRRVEPLARQPYWSDPRVVVVVDPVAFRAMHPEEQQSLDRFLSETNLEKVQSLSELKTRLGTNGRPLLLYWLGHAQPEALVLGQRELLTPRELRELLDTHVTQSETEGILVFLNACRTGVAAKEESFVMEGLQKLGVTGMIVAEHQTIDNYANKFGLAFLRGFLQGKQSLGALLHDLRLSEAPLGLIYGAYCPPEITVGPEPPPGQVGPIHEVDRAEDTIAGIELGVRLIPVVQPAPPLPEQPYRSLAYYDRDDRLLFTGRDRDIVRFAATLDQPDTRLLILHGESGIGKSSFLRAGVIPYLEEECVGYRFLRDARGQVVIIQAGRDPVGRLAVGLLEMTAQPLSYTTPTGERQTIDLYSALGEALGIEADLAVVGQASTWTTTVSPERDTESGTFRDIAGTLDPDASSTSSATFTAVARGREVQIVDARFGDPAGHADAAVSALGERIARGRTTDPAPSGTDPAVLLTAIVTSRAIWTVSFVVGARTTVDAARLRAALMADPGQLATLLERLSADLPHALVLMFDQAEELFTLVKEPDEIAARDQALRLLQRVADVRADVKVILALRTEYYGRLLDHLRAGRRDLIGVRDDLLRDLSRSALIKAITRPTSETPMAKGQPSPRERYRFHYADGIPEEIADRVLALRREHQDSVLPLVQVICTRLYDQDQAADRVVTQSDLEAIGGVEGGLKAFAEDALKRAMRLSLGDRDAFKAISTRLYSAQVDGTLTTWLARRADLEASWTGTRPFGEVLEAAGRVRLLREDNLRIEGEDAQAYVRLGHDALAKVAAVWKTEQEQKARLAQERARRRQRLRRVLAGTMAVILAVALTGFLNYKRQMIDHANQMKDLGMAFADSGDYPRAERCLEDALRICRSWLGEDNPQTLTAAKELADTYFMQGKFEQSEPLDVAVLNAKLKTLGEDHPNTLTSLVDVTNSYSYLRKYDLALPWYRKLLSVRLKHAADRESEFWLVLTRNDLAAVLQLTGRPQEAVSQLEQALMTLRQVSRERMSTKKKQILTAYTEVNFGWMLMHQHRPAQAEVHLQQVQSLLKEAQTNLWPAFAARSLLARIAMERKNGEDSVKELLTGYGGMIANTQTAIPPLEMACLDDAASWLHDHYMSNHDSEHAKRWRFPVKHRLQADQFIDPEE